MPPGKSPVGKNKNQAQQKQNSPPAARARTRSATAQGQSVAAAGAAEAPATATHASGFGADATAQLVQELMQAMAPRLERLEQGFATQRQDFATQMQSLQKEIRTWRLQMRAITVQQQQVTMQMQPDKAEQQAQFHSEQMQAMEQKFASQMQQMMQAMEQGFATQMQQMQEMEQRLQKEIAESRTDMADMAQSLRTEMKAMLQNEMQDSLAPFMQWRDHIDTQLTAYDSTLADFTTSHEAVQQEVRALADRLESMAPSKHYPGKLATARLQRHALTLCNEEPSKHYPGKLATARLQRHALTLRANSRVKKKRYTTSHTAVQKDVRALAARLDSLAPNVQDVMTQLETTGDTAKDIRAEPAEHERVRAAHWDVEQKHKALERAHAERCARLQAEVQKVRDLEQQQEDADGHGLLQFEAEHLRNSEKLLSSKELAFANPPRISPGSYTTPPAFLGGREEQLTRPSAPWTHSSRTRDFAYEQEKMRGNDRRPPPGSTYWLSHVVVAARRSSSTL